MIFFIDIHELIYPSLAVTNNALTHFGECCLIFNDNLLKSEKTIIYDRDSFTIRPNKFKKEITNTEDGSFKYISIDESNKEIEYDKNVTLEDLEKKLSEKFNNKLEKSEGLEFDDGDVSLLELESHYSKVLEYSDLQENFKRIKEHDEILNEEDEIINQFHNSLNEKEDLFPNYYQEKSETLLIQALNCFQNKEYEPLIEKLKQLTIIDRHNSEEVQKILELFKNKSNDTIDNQIKIKFDFLSNLMQETLNKFATMNTSYFEVKIKGVVEINKDNIKLVIIPKSNSENSKKLIQFLNKNEIKYLEYGDVDLNYNNRKSLFKKLFNDLISGQEIKLEIKNEEIKLDEKINNQDDEIKSKKKLKM